jgi:hypothetical protein
MPLALLALFAGYLLVNAAVRNEHPWCEIVRAFGGSCPPAPGVSGSGEVTPGTQTPIDPKTGGIEGGTYGPGAGEAYDAATPAAAAFAAEVFAKFNVSNAGICTECRTIRPHNGGSSSTISQHSFCNAVDVRGSAASMARVMVWATANRRRLHIRNLIPPGTSVNVVHADFNPPVQGSC